MAAIDMSQFAAPQYGKGAVQRAQGASEVLEQLDRLGTCRRAVTDLMGPGDDLHVVNRDDLAGLLAYLDEQYETAIQQLRAVLRE